MPDRPWIDHYDNGVPHSIAYPQIPLQSFLSESARKFPGKVCTICESREITYSQMDDLTTTMARSLVFLGLQKGDRVGILLPNLQEFVISFYATLEAGGVVAAINPFFTPAEIIHQSNDAGLKFLVATHSSYKIINSFRQDLKIDRVIVVNDREVVKGLQTGEKKVAKPDLIFEDVIDPDFSKNVNLPAVSGDDPAVFQYTGGTTGIPKAAIGLHRNLVANTVQFRRWLVDIKPGNEAFLMAIPMYHVYGMVIGMSLCIEAAGLLILIPNPRDVLHLVEELQRHRATIFPGVPSLFGMIASNPDVSSGKYNLRSVKAAISGSAPLPKNVKVKFEALISGQLCEGYGLSEAPTATHCNPLHGVNKDGSIGLPLPDVECRIVDMENGSKDLSTGEEGELIIRGPQVMREYHNMIEETQNVIRDGWLYTGDIARADLDGYYFLVGRKKELIKVSGFQVWPREVEDVIRKHSQVLDVSVSGVPDQYKGETVKAWIIKKPGSPLNQDEIKAWCEGSLAYYKIPSFVEFRTEFPRTTVGKILKRELIKQHLAGIDPAADDY